MNFRQLIRDYFTFSRNERKGIIVLLILIFLLAITNKLIFYFEKPASIDAALLDTAVHKLGSYNDSINQTKAVKTLFCFNPNSIDSVALDSLNIPESIKLNLLNFRRKGGYLNTHADFKKIYGVTDQIYNQVSSFLLLEAKSNSPKTTGSSFGLFPFDPNKAIDSEFIRLGFSEKQVVAIRKYQDKAGRFKDKADFFRIRAIREDQKRILSDWITIEQASKSIPEEKLKATLMVELNAADTLRLKQLQGIGSVLAKRIAKYRDLLGGFYSIDQLSEVYGLSEQTLKQLADKVTVDVSKIKKIDLNFSDLNELSRHPYIQKNLAKKIVKFRSSYGNIKDITVLRDSMILNIDEYTRIKPYF